MPELPTAKLRALHRAAQWCEQSYHDAPEFEGARDVRKFTHGSHAVFLFKSGNRQVLVFPGTEDLGDWLTNTNWKEDPKITICSIHNGVSQGVRALLKQALPYIKRNKLPLLLTGHSLGGALATTAPLFLKKAAILGVYTFGAFRPFDERAADILKLKVPPERILRVWHGHDVVTRLLLSGAVKKNLGMIDACHPWSTPVHLTQGLIRVGTDEWDSERKAQPDTTNRWAGFLMAMQQLHDARKAITGSVGDHAMKHYVAGLGRGVSLQSQE